MSASCTGTKHKIAAATAVAALSHTQWFPEQRALLRCRPPSHPNPPTTRCFPKFSDNFTSSVYSVLSPSAGVLGSAVATARDAFSSRGAAFSTYIADISKGIAIILVGGLTCGVVLSLVRPWVWEGPRGGWVGGEGRVLLQWLDRWGGCSVGHGRGVHRWHRQERQGQVLFECAASGCLMQELPASTSGLQTLQQGVLPPDFRCICWVHKLATQHCLIPWMLPTIALQFWMLILRFFSGLMAWLTIIAVNIGLIGCTVYAYANAGGLARAHTYILDRCCEVLSSWDVGVSRRAPAVGGLLAAAVVHHSRHMQGCRLHVESDTMLPCKRAYPHACLKNPCSPILLTPPHAPGLLSQAGQWGASIATQLPELMDPTLVSRDYWAYIAYALTAFTALILLITLVMLRRVAIAIACIKVGGGAVGRCCGAVWWGAGMCAAAGDVPDSVCCQDAELTLN